MNYRWTILTLLFVASAGNSSYLDGGWVSRYSDQPAESSFEGMDDVYDIKLRMHNREIAEYGDSNSKKEAPKRAKKDRKFDIGIVVKEPESSTSTTESGKIVTRDRASEVTNNRLKERVDATQATGMIALYKRVGYSFIWLNGDRPNKIAKELISIIKKDKSLPISSRSKRGALKLEREMNSIQKSSKISEKRKIAFDMELTKLYLNYAYYKDYGGIRWDRFEKKLEELTKKFKTKVGWEYYRPPLSPSDILIEAVATDSLKDVLNRAMPKRFKFKKLEKKLVQYLDLQKRGGWKNIPKFKRVKPNQKSSIVPKIRARLKLEDELKKCATPSDPNLYDKCMQKGVWRYKIRHGLKPNKIIDNSLRKALNIPISKKIAKMRLNLDRIKWLYRDEEPLRIELNIPSFRLNLYEHNKIVTTIRVITGKPNHPTPIFHNVMKYVVVNPYWKIPESIVKHEMLKHLIKDPYYYDRRGKILKKSWDENSRDVDPGRINWKKYYRRRNDENMHIPYYFMQVPGSRNALGKIKFLFPNKYSVYIHDTPARSLFFKTKRAFSHGCMRIQKPRELLKMLANYNENINVEKIMKKLGTTEKKTITLLQPVPVDITYLTSFVDDYGNLHFRPDIYKYDKYQLAEYRYPDLIGRASPKKIKFNPKKESQKKEESKKKPKMIEVVDETQAF